VPDEITKKVQGENSKRYNRINREYPVS